MRPREDVMGVGWVVWRQADGVEVSPLRPTAEQLLEAASRAEGGRVRVLNGEAEGEVLPKILAHNLWVLVHEMYELGIAPEFSGWVEEEPDDGPRVIRFPGA
ncbi:MAG: hypothetical protein MUF18_18450 [Fimbriiglobus sp.]|nr:hypothetical protein [Fimbriiglobus sp.]